MKRNESRIHPQVFGIVIIGNDRVASSDSVSATVNAKTRLTDRASVSDKFPVSTDEGSKESQSYQIIS